MPRPTFYAVKPNDVLLGAPEPKLPAGYATHYARFVPGAARGGFVAWGPAVGAWGDLARVVVHFASDIDPLDAAYETLPIASPFSDRNAAARISSLQAIPLAPGRALVVMCEDRSRCPLLYRAVAGAALERIDVSPIGEVASITNARELGGALLVVGTLAQHDPKAPPWKVDRAPFAALVTPAGVISTVFPRAAIGEEPSFSATVDAARGRFGLMAASLLPTWRGGTTYVLPIDATARPSGGFELLRTSSFEVSRPLSACANAVASWDRVEVVTRAGWSTPEVEISIDGGSMIHDRGEMVVRARLGADATCLDRLTFLGTEIAFQWDPVSRRAVLLRLEPKGGAGRQELTCPSINW